jgi:hypothetical protein
VIVRGSFLWGTWVKSESLSLRQFIQPNSVRSAQVSAALDRCGELRRFVARVKHNTFDLALDAGVVLIGKAPQAVRGQDDIDPREFVAAERRGLHAETRHPEPTRTLGGQRARNAANNVRSAGVSAKASTAQSSAEAFFRRELQTT